MTTGIILIEVSDGGHARELLDRLAEADTYATGRQVLTIYPDTDDDWFRPVARAMTMGEFFERFVGLNKQQPCAECATRQAIQEQEIFRWL